MFRVSKIVKKKLNICFDIQIQSSKECVTKSEQVAKLTVNG